jgi:hypothetical protein
LNQSTVSNVQQLGPIQAILQQMGSKWLEISKKQENNQASNQMCYDIVHLGVNP